MSQDHHKETIDNLQEDNLMDLTLHQTGTFATYIEQIPPHQRNLFIRFLVKEKCYGNFAYNLFFFRDTLFMGKETKCQWADDLILNSFYWRKTKEGEAYWMEINKKWQEVLEIFIR